MFFHRILQTQDVNWTYIWRSEDVLDVFWTSYAPSIYGLCLWGFFKATSEYRNTHMKSIPCSLQLIILINLHYVIISSSVVYLFIHLLVYNFYWFRWALTIFYTNARIKAQREKCPKIDFFLVRIFLYSYWIRKFTKSPYSVRIQDNKDQKKLGIWTIFTHWRLI